MLQAPTDTSRRCSCLIGYVEAGTTWQQPSPSPRHKRLSSSETDANHTFLWHSSTPHRRYDVLKFPPRTQSVWPIVATDELIDSLCFSQAAQMDSNEEKMVHQFLEEEAAAAANKEKHMAILLSIAIACGEGGRRSHMWRIIGWEKEIKA
jgi:hypothetical protein